MKMHPKICQPYHFEYAQVQVNFTLVSFKLGAHIGASAAELEVMCVLHHLLKGTACRDAFFFELFLTVRDQTLPADIAYSLELVFTLTRIEKAVLPLLELRHIIHDFYCLPLVWLVCERVTIGCVHLLYKSFLQ